MKSTGKHILCMTTVTIMTYHITVVYGFTLTNGQMVLTGRLVCLELKD